MERLPFKCVYPESFQLKLLSELCCYAPVVTYSTSSDQSESSLGQHCGINNNNIIYTLKIVQQYVFNQKTQFFWFIWQNSSTAKKNMSLIDHCTDIYIHTYSRGNMLKVFQHQYSSALWRAKCSGISWSKEKKKTTWLQQPHHSTWGTRRGNCCRWW